MSCDWQDKQHHVSCLVFWQTSCPFHSASEGESFHEKVMFRHQIWWKGGWAWVKLTWQHYIHDLWLWSGFILMRCDTFFPINRDEKLLDFLNQFRLCPLINISCKINTDQHIFPIMVRMPTATTSFCHPLWLTRLKPFCPVNFLPLAVKSYLQCFLGDRWDAFALNDSLLCNTFHDCPSN